MKELQVKIRPKEEDVCYYPEGFQKVLFLGLQEPDGDRYFRVNWASSGHDFWYPFAGGKNGGIYTTISSEETIIRLITEGCKFFSFETAEEMYRWLGHTVGL